ncbi:MAG TPA: methyltransferase domain-containing protein [Opitutaceae bacterium]|nr:methyltransferase domain-containing protein [Opitutaceae bacterium]
MKLRAIGSNTKWLVLARLQHWNSVLAARKFRSKRGLKIQLGCGARPLQGWVNCDYCRNRFSQPDLCFDLRNRFPFADGSAAIVHSEHVLEHIAYPGDSLHVLAESMRVLEPGGVLSIGVPDPGWVLPAYVNGSECGYFEWFQKSSGAPAPMRTRMEAVNYLFRQGGEHQFIYDEETLAALLARAGFVNVRRREFDPARDTEDRKIGTIYMDAEKRRTPINE